MQLIIAPWQITIERRATRSRTRPPVTDRLERRVAYLRELQAAERRREWAQNGQIMHGNPYERLPD